MKPLLLITTLFFNAWGFSQADFTTHNLEKYFVDKSGSESSLFEKKSSSNFNLDEDCTQITIYSEIDELNGTHKLLYKTVHAFDGYILIDATIIIGNSWYQARISPHLISFERILKDQAHNRWSFFNYVKTEVK